MEYICLILKTTCHYLHQDHYLGAALHNFHLSQQLARFNVFFCNFPQQLGDTLTYCRINIILLCSQN